MQEFPWLVCVCGQEGLFGGERGPEPFSLMIISVRLSPPPKMTVGKKITSTGFVMV
jgi:hypothetical protein